MPEPSTLANDLYRIGHMIQFCEQLHEAADGYTEEDLEDDWIRTLAIIRLFETLGEAASKVSKARRAEHPQIPWRDVTDMRNRLIHSYDDVEYEVVIKTIENDIPPLLKQLRELQHQLKAL